MKVADGPGKLRMANWLTRSSDELIQWRGGGAAVLGIDSRENARSPVLLLGFCSKREQKDRMGSKE